MTPERFERTGDLIKFYYKEKDYRYWKEIGLKEGTSGSMLAYMKEDGYREYRSFGTIENPNRNELKVVTSHFEAFDGKALTPEEFCIPPKPFSESYRIVVLDFKYVDPVKIKE